MWRDPLDDLIEDLEKVVPPLPQVDYSAQFVRLQEAVSLILYRPPGTELTPSQKAFIARVGQEMAARRRDASSTLSSNPSTGTDATSRPPVRSDRDA